MLRDSFFWLLRVYLRIGMMTFTISSVFGVVYPTADATLPYVVMNLLDRLDFYAICSQCDSVTV